MEDSEKITIRIPKRDLKILDLIMELDGYSTRSEVIRAAIREFTDNRIDFLLEKIEKLEKTEEKRAKLFEFENKYLRK
jgi:antitoxin ParD1/3/4